MDLDGDCSKRNLGKLVPVNSMANKKHRDNTEVLDDRSAIVEISPQQTEEAELRIALEGGVRFRPLCLSACGTRAWAADRTSFRLCKFSAFDLGFYALLPACISFY
jgi:hypothetical protein